MTAFWINAYSRDEMGSLSRPPFVICRRSLVFTLVLDEEDDDDASEVEDALAEASSDALAMI